MVAAGVLVCSITYLVAVSGKRSRLTPGLSPAVRAPPVRGLQVPLADGLAAPLPAGGHAPQQTLHAGSDGAALASRGVLAPNEADMKMTNTLNGGVAKGLSAFTGIQQGTGAGAGTFAGKSIVNMEMPSTRTDPGSLDWEASPSGIFAATALAATATAAETIEPKKKGLWDKIKLPVYCGLWYFFNVQYNIQNKRLLTAVSAPWAASWIQLAAGIPIALLMWTTGFVQKPKVTSSDVLKLAPVGAAFAAGQVATVASLGAVAVSFTHVVKALEPAINAIASALVLGQVFHPMVYASLLPVFAGVALASSSELSFTMFGFLTAMASNFFFVTRNVLATKFGSTGDMGEDATTRKTNQLAVLTFVASAVLLPVALLLPGGLLSFPAACKVALNKGIPASKLLYMTAASGFHFFMYQLSSFWVLSCVPPITHSVLNTLKRVVIIIVSIIVFRTPVTAQSAAGTSIAIGGVLLYSLTKAHYGKKK